MRKGEAAALKWSDINFKEKKSKLMKLWISKLITRTSYSGKQCTDMI